MRRLGELDLPDRLAPYAPAWATQVVFALLCTAFATGTHAIAQSLAPGAGPFALGFPAMLIATLFGRWQAGLITSVLAIAYGWYYYLPAHDSFALGSSTDASRLAVAIFTYAVMLVIAESFRRAVRNVADERDRQLAERDLYLAEFDHRVKNNFAVVASLLDLQRRRSSDPATKEALTTALARVEGIARAHRHLYRDGSARGVDLAHYLEDLCSALSEALLLQGTIRLDCHADNLVMPRDRAVSIGLVVNELVTNAAKHAFEGRDHGLIHIDFAVRPDGWRLIVADDGVGLSDKPTTGDGGLGQRLIEAFARQAGGLLSHETGPEGTRFTLDLAP